MIDKDYIFLLVEFLERHNEYSLVQANVYWIGKEISKRNKTRLLPKIRHDMPCQRLAKFIQWKKNFGAPDSIFGLIRRDSLMNTRLLESYIGSDYILLAELALQGKFGICEKTVFHRRYTPDRYAVDRRDFIVNSRWFDTTKGVKIYIPTLNLVVGFLQLVAKEKRWYKKCRIALYAWISFTLSKGRQIMTELKSALRAYIRYTLHPEKLYD